MACLLGCPAFLLISCSEKEGGSALEGWENLDPEKPGDTEEKEIDHQFLTRGLVMGWEEVSRPYELDYIDLASKNGINTFSIYNADRNSEAWKGFFNRAREAGIDFEFEEHMMSFLLPRELFSSHPEYFRMEKNGKRTKDANGCPSNKECLEVVKINAKDIARRYHPTNNKYYFWMDDGGGICHCPDCKSLNASDQALLFENAVIEAVREINPEAQVAHLCYHETLDPPKKIKPAEGIFLEFAPFFRNWSYPLSNGTAKGRTGISHDRYLKALKANLKIFPVETAQVLEYWMDDSLFSEWNPDKLVKIPWNPEIFKNDLDTYASFGIRHIMCYCAYVGPDYVRQFGFPDFLVEYGKGLYNYEKKN